MTKSAQTPAESHNNHSCCHSLCQIFTAAALEKPNKVTKSYVPLMDMSYLWQGTAACKLYKSEMTSGGSKGHWGPSHSCGNGTKSIKHAIHHLRQTPVKMSGWSQSDYVKIKLTFFIEMVIQIWHSNTQKMWKWNLDTDVSINPKTFKNSYCPLSSSDSYPG